MFEHDEYHIYTTNDSLDRVHVHLTEDMLSEAVSRYESVHNDTSDWQTTHRLNVGEDVYLSIGSAVLNNPVRLQSRGYEGWVPVTDGRFTEELFFDSMLFYQCIGEHGNPQESFHEMKEWVNREHRKQFEEEFDEYLSDHHDPDEVTVDW